MQGRIIKGIAGFYYVDTGSSLYECKAKGIFRNRKMKPLVGDMAEIEVLDEEKKLGNLTEILPRMNELIRPAVSNIDQALVIFAAKNPKPNYNLLDRFLLMMEKQRVPAVVCFNKTDLAKEKELSVLMDVYKDCGHRVIFTSVSDETGLSEIREAVEHKTTVLAGPSGVGKSSMLNLLYPDANMETGAVSEKIQRGKHTTRHSERRASVLCLWICSRKTRLNIILKNLNPMRDNAGSRVAAILMNLAAVSNRHWRMEGSARLAMTTMYSSTMN